ncbi:transglutaminase-like domain-containing protein [Streptomyces sp. WMMC500]|uniref:transglutaminase-like domain-containing protein n=1 Tax=Streptomyces sp. WMMC500 TaxID=3015154 RepID=UPI00248B349B|nr:transglutaminase-like domain-containing protein [Streptomyces sp. WMMC500]WBB60958.1 transglutaminase-like domain-containing protein [Streptomyces sp. WMMC500]
MTTTDLEGSLAPTEFLNSDDPDVRDFVRRTLPRGGLDSRDAAVRLYYAVRDGVDYEVYGVDLSRTGVTAAQVARTGKGMCVHKSVLYAAALRAAGIPARLVLTDVRNHLSSPALRARVGGDVIRYHTSTTVHLDGTWVRAAPVFNRLLCRLYGVRPLGFDGRTDSVHRPHDDGARHLEVVREHGEFDDLPYERLIDGMRRAHPGIFAEPGSTRLVTGSLLAPAICRTATCRR